MTGNLKQRLIKFLLNAPKFRGRYRMLISLLKICDSTPTYYGPTIKSRPHDYTNRAAVLGDYGDYLRDLIQDMPPNGLFLDVGANLGIYSLVAGQHLKHGKVVSFEPNQSVFIDLVENIALNSLTNVTALNCGVGEITQVNRLATEAGHTGGARISSEGKPIIVLGSDDIAPLLAPDLHRPILCKIDTEGFEFLILRAFAQSGILSEIDQLFVEINDAHLQSFGGSAEALYQLMDAHGFTTLNEDKTSDHHDAHFIKRD